ncbi:MAG: hypothetical protein A2734_01075 [Parcubacteria group bacterium RIFCSPHIGHO2_01_FULL_40_30]|nr:MAG: hypothetical protein A2734_01075 [Parcubacteria group bacterium RIFCSPHIGHO2_01_FULL_40_30]OHB19117.1 MAG: hypothetical protein A3D40_01050 [Parcubacteria group bacterium RIFCSPHIGHO2_02_FULL_40_12]OHB23147.1 MAG: hypothetical protein A3I22_01045 [Parcubacteria group bacterium RIFCSPLOWO2_02_FULL_40_12]OHB24168.1 MAG: hypothetical protein A3F96_00985 [Parcubacteria group bacterium RIFCSPLOWO2_12_FULL_40_10]
MKSKSNELEQNQAMTSLVVFIENYNKSIPKDFPRATTKALKEFQITHSALFKRPDDWSIEKHRKRLMDWLFSQD